MAKKLAKSPYFTVVEWKNNRNLIPANEIRKKTTLFSYSDTDFEIIDEHTRCPRQSWAATRIVPTLKITNYNSEEHGYFS